MSLYDPFTSTLDRVDALIIFSSYDSHYNKNTSKTRNYQTAWQTFEYKIYTNVIIRNHCIKLMAELHFHTLNCFDVYVQHKLRARTEIRVIPDVNLITDFFFFSTSLRMKKCPSWSELKGGSPLPRGKTNEILETFIFACQ